MGKDIDLDMPQDFFSPAIARDWLKVLSQFQSSPKQNLAPPYEIKFNVSTHVVAEMYASARGDKLGLKFCCTGFILGLKRRSEFSLPEGQTFIDAFKQSWQMVVVEGNKSDLIELFTLIQEGWISHFGRDLDLPGESIVDARKKPKKF